MLSALPMDTGLRPAFEALDGLVALEEKFSETSDPVRSLAEIDRTLDDLWAAAARLVGLGTDIRRFRNPAGDICEDVLLVSAGTGQEIVEVSRVMIREILRSVEPWARLAVFFGTRFDFLYTLGAFLRQLWPGRTEVSLLDAFRVAQPLWREYRKAAPFVGHQDGFNPLGLDRVSALAELRTALWIEFREILRALPADEIVSTALLEKVAAKIPAECTSPVGPCLFVQPADPSGKLWVLNRLFEGTGRYGSRFTGLMDEKTRRRYVGRFVRAATRSVDGEPFDLLDLLWSRQDTLNVHAIQTVRVLAIPGETLDRQAAKPVELRDLRVSLGPGCRDSLISKADACFRSTSVARPAVRCPSSYSSWPSGSVRDAPTPLSRACPHVGLRSSAGPAHRRVPGPGAPSMDDVPRRGSASPGSVGVRRGCLRGRQSLAPGTQPPRTPFLD